MSLNFPVKFMLTICSLLIQISAFGLFSRMVTLVAVTVTVFEIRPVRQTIDCLKLLRSG